MRSTPPTQPSLYELARVDELVDSTLGDVRDLEPLCERVRAFAPGFVFHMAAQSVVLRSYDDPVETYSTNVLGTVHLLEAVRRMRRACTVINVTTDKCYENKGQVEGYREGDALGGHDPYSNSKACAELVGDAYRESFFPVESKERARRGTRERACRQRHRRRRLDAHGNLSPTPSRRLCNPDPWCCAIRRRCVRGSTYWIASRDT